MTRDIPSSIFIQSTELLIFDDEWIGSESGLQAMSLDGGGEGSL
jgi:hypothetical protein